MIHGATTQAFLNRHIMASQLKYDLEHTLGLDHGEKHFASFPDDIFLASYSASLFRDQLR